MSVVSTTVPARPYALPRISILAACGLTFLGIAHLFSQPIWSHLGLERLGCYAVAFWIFASFQFVAMRRRALVLDILLVTAYAAILAGPLAVFSLACFIAAATGVGIAILEYFEVNPSRQGPFGLPLVVVAGLAAYSTLIGMMAYVGVNYPLVYWTLIAAGCLFLLRKTRTLSAILAGLEDWTVAPASTYWARSVCLFVLGAQFLMTLKPEIGADGRSMHLAIATDLYSHHYWHFDVSRLSWAVMPMGGDWPTAAAYLVGGEFAAKLFPFVLLIACTLLVFAICRSWLAAAPSFLLTAIFISLPVVQLTTGSMFVENYWTAVLTASAVSLMLMARTGNVSWLPVWGVLMGAGLAAKAITLAFVLPSMLWAAAECYKLRQRSALKKAIVQSLLLLTVIGMQPYLTAFLKTGNPLFPFCNGVFHSPYFAQTNHAMPNFASGLSWRLPFDLSFRTSAFLESQDGAAGLWFLFVPLLLIGSLCWKWPREAAWPAVVGVSFFLLTWKTASYLRYVLPAVPILFAPISWCLARALTRETRLGKAVGAVLVIVIVLVQTYLLASSGFTHKNFALNPLHFQAESAEYVQDAPSRILNAYLNIHAKGEPAVFLINGVAGFEGRPYVASWHDYPFFDRLGKAATVRDIDQLFAQLDVKYILAPLPECAAPPLPLLRPYLERYTHERFRTHCAYIAERGEGAGN